VDLLAKGCPPPTQFFSISQHWGNPLAPPPHFFIEGDQSWVPHSRFNFSKLVYKEFDSYYLKKKTVSFFPVGSIRQVYDAVSSWFLFFFHVSLGCTHLFSSMFPFRFLHNLPPLFFPVFSLFHYTLSCRHFSLGSTDTGGPYLSFCVSALPPVMVLFLPLPLLELAQGSRPSVSPPPVEDLVGERVQLTPLLPFPVRPAPLGQTQSGFIGARAAHFFASSSSLCLGRPTPNRVAHPPLVFSPIFDLFFSCPRRYHRSLNHPPRSRDIFYFFCTSCV